MYYLSILTLIVLIFSCNKEIREENADSQIESESKKQIKNELNLEIESHSTLEKWVNYYRENAPAFNLNNFKFKSTDTLNFTSGTVFGSFNNEFDSVYYDFIKYNSNKTKYLDIDSYQWSLDDNQNLIISPDQEINLVDVSKQKVTRLRFNGPSYWVEDAFWENDSIIIFLENSYERIPVISRLNLKTKNIDYYQYYDSLDFNSEYSTKRLLEKGIYIEVK